MKRGFTLLELFIVLVVIGIISSLGIVRYLGTIEKARQSEARIVCNQIMKAEEMFFTRNNVYTTDISALDIGAIPQGGNPNTDCSTTHYFTYKIWIAPGFATGDLIMCGRRCKTGGKPPDFKEWNGHDDYYLCLGKFHDTGKAEFYFSYP